MKANYAALALSYRKWHHRVTPVAWEHMDPALGLAAFHATNVFSLLMLAPANSIRAWLFALIPVSCGAAFAWYISRIYRSEPAPSMYARLHDPAPGVSEFPLVYAYLFGTLLLFVGCLYVAVRGAA